MLTRATNGRRSGGVQAADRGSVLALVPAGFLVLVLLAALAVDSAVSYQAQQELHDDLAVAATDSVDAGLDSGAFYANGSVVLDPAAVDRVVCSSMAAQASGGELHDIRVAAAISGRSLTLTGRAAVRMVFGAALPGFGTRSVQARAKATLEAAPGPASTGPGVAYPITCPALESG